MEARTSGFDTIAYSVPIHGGWDIPPGTKRAHLRVVAETGATTGMVKLPSGGTLKLGWGDVAVVEASVPKLGGDHNVYPASWGEVVDAARWMVAEAEDEGYVKPGRFEDGRFVRVDAVRDFEECQGWSAFAPRLKSHVWAPRGRTSLYQDRSRRGSLSLAVGNKSWRAIAYDKGAESALPEAAGRVRFELTLRRRWVASAEPTLENDGRLSEVRKQVFTKSGLGTKVSGMQELLLRLLRSDLPTSRAHALLGYVVAQGSGVDLPMAKDTRRKYRQLARDLGLAFDPADAGGAITAALDYDQGRLVLEAA